MDYAAEHARYFRTLEKLRDGAGVKHIQWLDKRDPVLADKVRKVLKKDVPRETG